MEPWSTCRTQDRVTLVRLTSPEHHASAPVRRLFRITRDQRLRADATFRTSDDLRRAATRSVEFDRATILVAGGFALIAASVLLQTRSCACRRGRCGWHGARGMARDGSALAGGRRPASFHHALRPDRALLDPDQPAVWFGAVSACGRRRARRRGQVPCWSTQASVSVEVRSGFL